MHLLWFYKYQHDNRTRSKLSVACQRWLFQLRFAAILGNCAPSGEMRNYCTPHIIKENFENFLIHRCNYILLSQVYCVWQVVKTPTIILNNPVYSHQLVVGFSGTLFIEEGFIKFEVWAALDQISRPKMLVNLKTKNFCHTVKSCRILQEPD